MGFKFIKNTGIVKAISELKIWLSIGQGYFFDFRYPVLLAIALKVYFPNATLFQMGVLVVIVMVVIAVTGWIDLNFIKLHQTQAEIVTRKYNPYYDRVEKKIDALAKKLK